jgi:MICOS complex subunit MIC19
VRFSQNIVDHLESSAEVYTREPSFYDLTCCRSCFSPLDDKPWLTTYFSQSDSTRSKALELHIQARVAEELKRLQEREAQTLEALSARLSTEDSTAVPSAEPSSASASDASSTAASKASLDRESVQAAIDSLRRKLEARKTVRGVSELDAEVEPARERVIQCLRAHNRRPLECSEEVAAFKEAVGRVEDRWVEKILR